MDALLESVRPLGGAAVALIFVVALFWPALTRRGSLRQQLENQPPLIAERSSLWLRLYQLCIAVAFGYAVAVLTENHWLAWLGGTCLAYVATELLYRWRYRADRPTPPVLQLRKPGLPAWAWWPPRVLFVSLLALFGWLAVSTPGGLDDGIMAALWGVTLSALMASFILALILGALVRDGARGANR